MSIKWVRYAQCFPWHLTYSRCSVNVSCLYNYYPCLPLQPAPTAGIKTCSSLTWAPEERVSRPTPQWQAGLSCEWVVKNHIEFKIITDGNTIGTSFIQLQSLKLFILPLLSLRYAKESQTALFKDIWFPESHFALISCVNFLSLL